MRPLIPAAVATLWLALVAPTAGQVATPTASAINPVVMKINGEPVFAAEISLAMLNISGQLELQGQAVSNSDLLKAASQRVIEQKLLAQEARRFGLAPEEERVAAMMRAAEQQSGGREALETTLARGGSTLAQLEQQYRELELGRVFIGRQIRPTVVVTDAEVDEFRTSHPELLVTPEQVHARDILIRIPEGAGDEVEREALERARQARARALAGEDFAALARELSEGPTAATGGDLGWSPRPRLPEPLSEAAFALAPGQVSEPVRTGSGYHVIKVEERRPGGEPPLEEARTRARTLLTSQRTADRVGELIATLYRNATVEVIDPAAPDGGVVSAPPAHAPAPTPAT